MLGQFLLYSKVIHTYIYIHTHTHTHTHSFIHIYTFFFSYHPPSYSIPKDWTQCRPMLYNRIFFFFGFLPPNYIIVPKQGAS